MTALVGRVAATNDFLMHGKTHSAFRSERHDGILFAATRGKFDVSSFYHERKARAIHGQPANHVVFREQNGKRFHENRTHYPDRIRSDRSRHAGAAVHQ
jgi:hypothetical protein